MIIRFGCNKVLNREFVGWANLLKEHLFDFSDFLRAFIFDRKHLTLSSKLKSLVSFVKNVVFYKKTSKIEIWMFYICLLFFLTVTKIYDYILNIWTDSLWIYEQTFSENVKYTNRRSNIWTDSLWKFQIYEQTVTENVKCFWTKTAAKAWEMPQVLPRNIRSRYNHESLVSGSVK